jgi:Effector Associated Constant Component 1
MTDRAAQLTVRVEDEEADPEELADLTAHLRHELLDLDVETVESSRAGPPPPGSRAVDLAALGTLVVTVAQPELLVTVVTAVRAWLAGSQQRSVKVTLDGDTLELTGLSSKEQRRVVDQWLDRHTKS